VILAVIVDENGKMKDIRVVKALPYGLSRQAILAAEKWTLQPATGPDGKPAAVRQFVEMVFRLA
jgi:TonB family protein